MACLLFCAAMLVYSGRVLGIDGRGVIATSETFIKQQSWDINLISAEYWTAPPPGGQGVWNADTLNIYSKKAPLTAILHIPLAYLGLLLPSVGLVQLALLTIPLIYAASGILFFHVARLWGIQQPLALIGSVWWGLGTFALANTVEVFAEPIMAFGVLLIFYAYLMPHSLYFRAFLVGVGVAIIAGGNLASAPLGLVVIFPLIFMKTTWTERIIANIVTLLPIAVMLGLIAYFNWLRSGHPFVSGYYFDSGEGFNVPFYQGFFGLLFSGYRGIIWYAPIVCLSLFGWWLCRKQHVTHMMLIVIGMQIAIYSQWWAWHGGGAWGPRFLLPILPLCVLLALPVISHLWKQSRIGKAIIIFLVLWSALLQIPSNFVHYIYYEIDLYTRYPDGLSTLAYLNPLESPILGHLSYLVPENAWSAWLVDGQWLSGVALILCLLIQVALLFASYAFNHKNSIKVMAIVISIISASVAVGTASSAWLPDNQAIETYITENIGDDETLILNGTSYWNFVYIDNRPPLYSIPIDISSDDIVAQNLIEQRIRSNQHQWYLSASPTANWIEAHIWETNYVGNLDNIDGNRMMAFRSYDGTMHTTTNNIAFSKIQLTHYDIAQDGSDIFLNLHWQGTLPQSATMFIHLLDENDTIIQQHDRLPLNGLVVPNDGIEDKHLFRIPDNYLQQALRLRLGWVDSNDNLIAHTGDDSNSDFLIISIPN